MTVPAAERKAGPFNGNGSTTSFPFTFKVFTSADVEVIFADADGVETVLALDSDYSVALNADQDATPGGSVGYPISGAALATGEKLSIAGALAYEQETDIPTGGNFNPTVLENALDKLSMQTQQLAEAVSRAAKVPITNAADAAALSQAIFVAANNIAGLQTIVTNIDDIQTVAADLNEPVSEIDTVATNIASVNTVGANISNVNTVAGVSSNVTTVAGVSANVTTVAGIAANVTAVAGNSTNVNAVAAIDDEVTTVATNIAAVLDAPTQASAAASSASSAAASAAAAAASLDNFDDRYLGSKSSAPTLDNDGNALVAGALYFNNGSVVADDKGMWIYDGGTWIQASAASQAILVKYKYVATAGQTTFTGPDANALTLSYTAGSIIVTLNGAVLDATDYTATNGSSVVLGVAAALNDEIGVFAFSTFDIANAYTKAESDVKYLADAANTVELSNLARQGTAGQVLTSGGAGADPSYTTLASGPSGISAQVFTANGTFTIPTGITALKVTVVGGGGNGGGGSSDVGSGGGGGGGAAIKYLTGLTPGNTLTVTRGAAGGTSSVASGTQTISTISATGGSAGGGGGSGGSGGIGSGGDLNIKGSGGDSGGGYSGVVAGEGGSGGSSLLGGGGRGPYYGIAAEAGGAYGGGGSGSGGGGGAGGAGAAGVVLFEW